MKLSITLISDINYDFLICLPMVSLKKYISNFHRCKVEEDLTKKKEKNRFLRTWPIYIPSGSQSLHGWKNTFKKVEKPNCTVKLANALTKTATPKCLSFVILPSRIMLFPFRIWGLTRGKCLIIIGAWLCRESEMEMWKCRTI